MNLSHLTEAKQHLPFSTSNDLARKIVTDCHPWLMASRGHIFYRGVSNHLGDPAYLNLVRPDRKPMSTPDFVHRFYNDIIAFYGKKANRSNSMFGSGDERMAHGFGSIYAVYPIGEFNYTWSPHERDWYDDYASLMYTMAHKLYPDHYLHNEQEIYNKLNEIGLPTIKKKIPDLIKGDDASLVDALLSRNEVMIHCEKAYYVSKELFVDVEVAIKDLMS